MKVILNKFKHLSPNLVLIYVWLDVDTVPHCGCYYNNKLISNVHWDYDTVEIEDVVRFLENAEPEQLIAGYNRFPERI